MRFKKLKHRKEAVSNAASGGDGCRDIEKVCRVTVSARRTDLMLMECSDSVLIFGLTTTGYSSFTK
jgi:hypothetical protein